MADTWKERILWVANEFAGGNQRQVARDIKFEAQTVNAWAKGRAKPTGDAVAAIIVAYPEVNPDWLLTGRGPRRRVGGGEELAIQRTAEDFYHAVKEVARLYGVTERPEGSGAGPAPMSADESDALLPPPGATEGVDHPPEAHEGDPRIGKGSRRRAEG